MKKMLNGGNQYSILYYVCENFCDPFYNGSGTVISYDSGSAKFRTVSLRLKVTVPVPQNSA
jgi:hypothetical protein